MRRILSAALLMLALLIVGAGVATAYQPAQQGTPDYTERGQVRYGMGGKISLPPPPAGSPAGTTTFYKQLAPLRSLALPVFGVDVVAGSGNETVIVSDPTRPLYFLAGANYAGSGHYTTTDGGATWIRGSFSGIGDPAAAYDDQGNAYFAELTSYNCPDPVRVHKSTDGGVTWPLASTTLADPSPSDHFTDKEWITVDNAAGSPFHGRVYAVATSFYAPACNLNAYINNREILTWSSDGGTTWSPVTTISDASHDQDQFVNPIVANNGTVYVSYQYQNCTYNCNGIPAYQMLTRSTDGGINWSPSITVTGQPISYTGASVGGYQNYYASSTSIGFRHNDQAIIGVSPTNPNQLYAVWNDGRWDTTFVFSGVTGWHGDIAFTRSTDGGTTWAAPVRINDDPLANGRDQFFPWMTVGSDGTIHVSWMDRRDTAGFQYREYYTQSTDGGLTWSANQAVSDAGTTPSSFIGDYSGIAVNSNNTIVMPVWTDQRAGQSAYIDRGIMGGLTTPTATSTVIVEATFTPTSTAVAITNTPTATSTGTPEPMCTPAYFTDVSPTDYFYAAVQYLTCRGAISGYADNTFRPYNDTTRGQLTKIVVIAERFPIDTTGGPHFTDVPTSNPFYAFIETAYNRGLISGYSDGTFRWGNNITRAQLSKVIVLAEGWAIDTTGGPHFSDVPTTNPFYGFVETAYNHGIISGYSDGTFRPNNNATRGQISVIVYRALTAP